MASKHEWVHLNTILKKNSPSLHAFNVKETSLCLTLMWHLTQRSEIIFSLILTSYGFKLKLVYFFNTKSFSWFITFSLFVRKADMVDNKPAKLILIKQEKREVSKLVNFITHTCKPTTNNITRDDAGYENPFLCIKV